MSGCACSVDDYNYFIIPCLHCKTSYLCAGGCCTVCKISLISCEYCKVTGGMCLCIPWLVCTKCAGLSFCNPNWPCCNSNPPNRQAII
uniref:Uncharacterized protein n=1 Tax=viral metagenome TaxID=1070528 RepID=A0A6C0EJR5_9ZZZZ